MPSPAEAAGRRRRWFPRLAWTLSVLVAGAAGWWAASATTKPPHVGAPVTDQVSIEVTDGTVDVEQAYGITVEWPASPLGVNGLTGTVTTVDVPRAGALVDAGDVLYTVDLAPVVVAAGDVPAFRDMGPGAVGADVRQLQQFLVDRGFLSVPPDGRYAAQTAQAVSAWSASLGLEATDSVPRGRLTFLPRLPARVAPGADLFVGASVAGGQQLMVGVDAEPAFSFVVLPEALARTTVGMAVRIGAAGGEWHAQVSGLATATDGSGQMVATLTAEAGASSVCGADCSSAVAVGGQAILPGTLEVVPPTSGSQVPTAALRSESDGGVYVTLDDGSHRAVTVLASADGRSIVSGVDVGERIVMLVDARSE